MNVWCRKSIQFSHFVVFALFFCLPASTHAAFFTGLGDLPGGPFESRAFNISADGTVVVGTSTVDTYEYRPGDERPVREAFRWTRESGVQSLGTLPRRPQSFANGVSSDGSVIVGYIRTLNTPNSSDRSDAFRWTEQEGIVALGALNSPCVGSWAEDVSGDGATVVGESFSGSVAGYGCVTEAFRFTDEDGMIGLGLGDELDFEMNESWTSVVSADGTIVGGSSRDVFVTGGIAWLWHEATGEFTDLGVRGIFPTITDMTSDASKVIGYTRLPLRPFLWTEEAGAVELSVPSRPVGISDNGSVIVGRGWIWTETAGARDLVDLLTDDFGLGEQLAGWRLGDVPELSVQGETDVSGNGRTIVGTGTNPDGNPEAWIAILEPSLQAGDADQDYDFDQLDLVQVQIASKYLTGEAATWGEGDWTGAPGGVPGIPPAGDGMFSQLDIVAAQVAGIYLTGSYDAVQPDGRHSDSPTSVGYDARTGELWVDSPAGRELTSINIDSAADIFTGRPAQNLGGSFDNDADGNIFKAMFGDSFGSMSFGNVAQTGLSEHFILQDLTVTGSFAGGGGLSDVDLIYVPVPEPSSVMLLLLGLCLSTLTARRRHGISPFRRAFEIFLPHIFLPTKSTGLGKEQEGHEDITFHSIIERTIVDVR